MAGDSSEEQKKRETPPPLEFLKPGEAQAPPTARDQPPAAWVPQPEEYQRPPQWTQPAGPRPGVSNLPRIAGALLVLAGVLGMAGSIYSAVTLPSVAAYRSFLNNSPAYVAIIQICGLIVIWSQAMALLGGVMAFQRMNWKLTLVCAIFSLATLGYFFFEASIVGLIALIVTIMARPHFVT